MNELLPDIDRWQTAGTPIALATVVQTWGSAPRQAGAIMALTPDNQMVGSVSGGCVEGAVFDEGIIALTTEHPKLLHFGVTDETAWSVGLACGGSLDVFVAPLNPQIFAFRSNLITTDRAGTIMTVIQGPDALLGNQLATSRSGERVGTLGDLTWDDTAVAVAQQTVNPLRWHLSDTIELFIDPIRPARKLIIVGGVHIAVALATLAKTVGYHTTVVDPRRAFGNEDRFPHVDKLISAWPDKALSQVTLDEETAVVLLTHDPKIDDPALQAILDKPVFYIGALGSRATHAKRVARLEGYGFSEAQIARIHSPVGLSIGAATPQEIGLAVMAEIVQVARKP